MSSAVFSLSRAFAVKPFHWLDSCRLFVRSVVSFAVVPAVTWLAFQSHLNLTATSLLQLLAVLAIALRVGFWPAAVASIFANLCLNYFFVPPLFSLYIADPQNWIAVGVFEISALIVSRLSTQARQEATRAITREREIKQLYNFSVELLLLARDGRFSRDIVTLVERIFEVDAVLLDGFDERIYQSGRRIAPDLESEMRAAYLGQNATPRSETGKWIRVLCAAGQPIAALGLRGTSINAMTVDALASVITIALERERSMERETQAEAERKTEQLRTAVLDALAHEYKTPLTALRAATSGLIEIGNLSTVQLKLTSLIDSEVARLNWLTTRLLRMSRLDGNDVKLRPELVDPNDLVCSVLTNMKHVLAGHNVCIEHLNDGALIKVDQELVGMALSQFIDNALKYSDSSTPITVSISAADAEVCLSVNNLGTFIPQEERGRIFQRFYRGAASTHKPGGSGVGLSISRKIADAHQGRVWVTSVKEGGTTFSLALPKYERSLHE